MPRRGPDPPRRQGTTAGGAGDHGGAGGGGGGGGAAPRGRRGAPLAGPRLGAPPPAGQAIRAARRMAVAPSTPPADAVEMLDCLAAAGTPADRTLLDELRRGPPSPVRDRAVELGDLAKGRE